ncbi:Pkinase-domain-containing protein [Neocallimastix lanati (nom. inval.)]|jgi:MAP/microtubule affinity-regulating kinase|uniref:non-specific serine/threonine protein kinase n=1 Tax=Neocallimastix californiae TaxID=1754190 RepID=A0A1Y2ACS4_9FUNG|nr:Pkinase-domain-containing protein [Neocallimastix sp. JGI-2020a]ORY20353.1 Pkinase-domain-containing protein [Neocallimastix californiae]|eukprot:ORY20353.1 Pkinase-domain-containing protein [Neocallimastix californiae]
MPHHRRNKDDSNNPELSIASIGNYVFQKTVGEGNFAKVKLAKHKLTGVEVAIKIIDKTRIDEKKLGKLYREVKIMKFLNHPNIVKLFEVIETKNTLFLVMEYSSGGELYDYLVVHGRMKEKEARVKFRQILSAVNYCHNKRVIHRDLKAENLLLDANFDIKIADFGFSNYYDPESKLDTFCGSPPYAAPELFQGKRYTGPEVDIWSLGVILYVLTTGCLPFDGKNLQEMRESVCRGKYRIPFYLSDSCEKLLRKFLVRDPYKRASLEMLIDDPWINEGYSDSPIKKNEEEVITTDESIIQFMVEKYKFDREQILKSLDDNVYDDTSAIYYLLYNEKKNKNSLEGILSPISDNTSTKSPEKDKDQEAASPTKKNGMVRIDEDDVLPANNTVKIPTAVTPTNATGTSRGTRTRRFTVTGITADHPVEAPMALPKPGTLENSKAVQNPSALNTSPTTQQSVSAHPQIKEDEELEVMPSLPKPSGAEPTPTAADVAMEPRQPRKRHNTIVGIFLRNKDGQPVPSVTSPTTESSNDSSVKPRSLRFTFNSNSTSTKQPDEIVRNVLHACKALNITHKLVTRYLIECNIPEKEDLKFEVEICKLPRLNNMHGLKFKRLSGTTADYKEICEKLLNTVEL